jgi:surface protein
MESVFAQSGITNVVALAIWDVSKVTHMNRAFSSTHELENIDGLSEWKTTSLESIHSTFSNSGITNVDGLADWNVSKVSRLDWAFVGDDKLTNINGLASWDVSSVTSMEMTFQDTSALTSLEPLSSWAPTLSSSKNALQSTFAYSGATSLKGLENFDVSHVTKLDRTFAHMENLKTLGGVEDDGQGGTKKVGLKGWEDKTGNITFYVEVFAYDTAIEDLSAVTGWIVPDVTSTSGVGSFYQVPTTATDYYLVPFNHL